MKIQENKKQKLEVADLFRLCNEQLRNRYSYSSNQLKAVDDILSCRTVKAGGHISYCNSCSNTEQSYNSCRNRHCPKCQFIKQVKWVDKLKGRMFPGRYFHIVFTVPQGLHSIFYSNQRACYDILFQASKEALMQAGLNPEFLGADVGAIAVLHTWGQTLNYHPHIHMIVPAGGLDEDMQEWIGSPKNFFVPINALSSMFRGIFMKYLKQMIDRNQLKLPDDFSTYDRLKQDLYKKNWNVYSKKAFGGMDSVLEYLGRYTHRVAISNSRLISVNGSKVLFRYKDNRSGGKQREMELDIVEFCRRFLQHILPSGFYKIRYFGILATAHIHTKREQAIALIGKTMWLPEFEGLSGYDVLKALLKKEPLQCKVCGEGIMTNQREMVQLE